MDGPLFLSEGPEGSLTAVFQLLESSLIMLYIVFRKYWKILDHKYSKTRDLWTLFWADTSFVDSLSADWSPEGKSFVMRSPNPCPENFSENVVDYPNLLRGGEVIYYVKSEVLDLESNLLFLGGGRWGGGNLLHAIGM